MKAAVIDMGTNTFHLMIVEINGGDFTVLYKEKAAVRLGKGGINKGLITEDAWERAISTLIRFTKVIEDHEAAEIFATATSAVRNAGNGQELVDAIKATTGIDTRIISGLEEASYIYYGVQKALDIGDEPALIMDIGGGSIEFIIANMTEVYWLESFEIGGQRMMEIHHQNDPITDHEIKNLEEYLSSNLIRLFEAVEKFKPTTLIGSSGTFDTLSEIYQNKTGTSVGAEATEFPFTIAAFKDIFQDLVVKSRKERLDIAGMIPLRVDMIVVASVLINFIIKSFDIQSIRVSAYALKEGVLLKTVDSLTSHKSINTD
ncbi:MAG: exopolyphosphatase/guanosine-5'-triphosphate,3'-diphosphate pyrophosphatase [Cyclobacteriaceae bacterium]|jgi:exopolyphosphatase/guanosine-5'-triphosphate,3'-diphosphate pyrophosphatase